MELTDENFEEEVLAYKGPVLVDFWGSWCLACQQMHPVVKKMEKELDEKIGHLNIDKNPKIAARYNIEETPTHILFKNGNILRREAAAKSRKQLEKMIKESD